MTAIYRRSRAVIFLWGWVGPQQRAAEYRQSEAHRFFHRASGTPDRSDSRGEAGGSVGNEGFFPPILWRAASKGHIGGIQACTLPGPCGVPVGFVGISRGW